MADGEAIGLLLVLTYSSASPPIITTGYIKLTPQARDFSFTPQARDFSFTPQERNFKVTPQDRR